MSRFFALLLVLPAAAGCGTHRNAFAGNYIGSNGGPLNNCASIDEKGNGILDLGCFGNSTPGNIAFKLSADGTSDMHELKQRFRDALSRPSGYPRPSKINLDYHAEIHGDMLVVTFGPQTLKLLKVN